MTGTTDTAQEPIASESSNSLLQSPLVWALIVFLGSMAIGIYADLLIFSIVSGLIFALLASTYQGVRYDFLRSYSRKTGMSHAEIKGTSKFGFLQYGQYWDMKKDYFFVIVFLFVGALSIFTGWIFIISLVNGFYVWFHLADVKPRMAMAQKMLANTHKSTQQILD